MRTAHKKFFFFVACAVLVLVVASCDGDERRADRLWRQATERVEKGDTQGAVDRLQKILDDYPDTRIAAKAREQIIVYRGLATAVQSYPARRARELMVQIARAIEVYRNQSGHPPASLEDLVPARMASIPKDPWEHPFVYEATARGYRLRCQGSDGAPGGEADAADLVVVDGAFVTATP